jgi:hypothetical protein
MDDIPATRKQTLTRRIWIALIILYVAGLHAVVGLAIIKTDLASRALRKLSAAVSPEPAPAAIAAPPPVRDYQKELAAIVDRDLFFYPLITQYALTNLIPPDAVFFVGDSMVRGLNVAVLSPVAVNLGLSGDNTAGTLYRIRQYRTTMPHFQNSRLLVISIGTNNLGLGPPADALIARDVRHMLASRPRQQRLVLINLELQRTCAAFANCSFLNAGRKMRDGDGNLAAKYHKKNDAFHLSPAAYAYWVEELRAILPDLPVVFPGSPSQGTASAPTAGLEPALPR